MDTGGFIAGAIVGKLLLDKSGWDSSIKAIAKSEVQLNGTFGNIANIAKKVGVAIAAGISAATVTILHMSHTVAELGHEINEMSERTGISAEMLSTLKLAADKGGSSLDGLAIGLRFLSKSMYAAYTGSKEALDIFGRLGISVKTPTGQMRDMGKVLLDVSDRFASLPAGAEKSYLAIKLFGRSGTQLIPMLNMGSAAIKEQMELAQKMGIVFTEKTAKAADEYIDSLKDLQASFRGVKTDIANVMIPILTRLSENTVQAISEMRKKISQFVESGDLKTWAVETARVFLSSIKIMLQGLEGLIVGIKAVHAVFIMISSSIDRALGDVAQSILTNMIPSITALVSYVSEKIPALGKIAIELSTKIMTFFADFKKAAYESADRATQSSKKIVDSIPPIIEAFNAVLGGIDTISSGLTKGGLIGKKSFQMIEESASQMADSAEKNLKQLMLDIDKEGFYQDFEINLDPDSLIKVEDEARLFIADIVDSVSSGFESMQDKIKKGMDSLNPLKGGIADLRLELNMSKAALQQWGGIMPFLQVEELKNRIGELQEKLKDATPWQQFKYHMEQTISSILPQLNSILSQLQTSETTALDNEYKLRLANIEATVTNEEKKQKAITALEAEYEIKKSKARRKWAIADKALNISEAYINASQAVLKTYGQAGIFGIPLAAIIKALCAIEIAAIIAAPVEFAAGAAFGKETHIQNAIVGEAGPEYLLPEAKLVKLVQDAFFSKSRLSIDQMAAMKKSIPEFVINGPLIQTTGLTQADCDRASGMIMRSLTKEMRTSGVAFA